MPANVAHMLIAHKTLQKLKSKGVPEYAEFGNLLDDEKGCSELKNYVNLGSLGPDLFYYSNLAKAAGDMLLDGYVKATGYVPWSYQLHAKTPNRFPRNLLEIIFRDVVREGGEARMERQDLCRLAFLAGYLTHMAADQIIHPLVNSIAGPYYRSGENRRTHRECEVYQDYFLYENVYELEGKKDGSEKYDFFEQDFRGWADCVKGLTFTNTEGWFRYFLQRGFVETYGTGPEAGEIEDSTDNLLLALRASQKFGPYKDAAEDYQQKGTDSELYKKYIQEPGYLRHYRMAVELGVIYLIALYEMHARLKEGRDLTKKQRERFLEVVSDADLSSPLQKNILDRAIESIEKETKMDKFTRDHTLRQVQALNLIPEKEMLDGDNEDAEVVKS